MKDACWERTLVEEGESQSLSLLLPTPNLLSHALCRPALVGCYGRLYNQYPTPLQSERRDCAFYLFTCDVKKQEQVVSNLKHCNFGRVGNVGLEPCGSLCDQWVNNTRTVLKVMVCRDLEKEIATCVPCFDQTPPSLC